MIRQLRFRQDALDAYRALRSDPSSEAGKQFKAALERLIEDPGTVRTDCSRWDSLSGKVWSLPLPGPDGKLWLILWADLPPDAIEVYYIGPAPGEAPTSLAWTSEST